jgi:alpha-L-arabinofuranosidase
MKLYRDHFQPLRVACQSPESLNVTATRSPDGRRVVIKVVNADGQAQTADLVVDGPFRVRSVRAQRVAAALEDRNTLQEPNRITPVTVPVQKAGNRIALDLPPLSVTVVEMSGSGLPPASE